jgi:hypothetical protein
VVDASPDGWFADQTGPSAAAEEAARVTARLATPSEGATRAGLPRRTSKAHLVPGTFETVPAPEGPRRSPEELRERFRGYRAGLRRPSEDDGQGATV